MNRFCLSLLAVRAIGRGHRGRRATAVCLAMLVAPLMGAAPAVAVDLRAGDILVAEQGSGGVIRVDPSSGAQTLVSLGGSFREPTGIALEASGDLLVTDESAIGLSHGALFRVDPETGDQQVVSSAGSFSRPFGVALEEDGDILVSDPHAFGFEGAIFRVDPLTGAQEVVSSGGFRNPFGIVLEADGDILVADAGDGNGGEAVIRVDAETGAQETVSSGGSFSSPIGIALEADGDILVADQNAFGGAGGVIRVDPVTGAQQTVSSGGSFATPGGVAVEADGDILVTHLGPVGAAGVSRVDPVTGAQQALASGGSFSRPVGVAVVPPSNAAPDCSTVAADAVTLLPPTRQLTTITLSGASDPDGDALAFHIDSVHQDEPITGAGDDTSPDAEFVGASADLNQVRLRAERSSKGNGRVYRVAYTVSDGTATCSGIATVSVPRKKDDLAVDDGDTMRWDSFTGGQVLP